MSKVRDKAAQIIDLTEECPICMETMEDGACYLSSTHNFCFPCLLKHLSTSKRNCPCCRRPILESTTEIQMGANWLQTGTAIFRKRHEQLETTALYI